MLNLLLESTWMKMTSRIASNNPVEKLGEAYMPPR